LVQDIYYTRVTDHQVITIYYYLGGVILSKVFEVPVSWQVATTMRIEAADVDDAYAEALASDLPTEGLEYVEDSFNADYENITEAEVPDYVPAGLNVRDVLNQLNANSPMPELLDTRGIDDFQHVTIRKYFTDYLMSNYVVDADTAKTIATGVEYFINEQLIPTVVSDNSLVQR
jgi:hypothetical protein